MSKLQTNQMQLWQYVSRISVVKVKQFGLLSTVILTWACLGVLSATSCSDFQHAGLTELDKTTQTLQTTFRTSPDKRSGPIGAGIFRVCRCIGYQVNNEHLPTLTQSPNIPGLQNLASLRCGPAMQFEAYRRQATLLGNETSD